MQSQQVSFVQEKLLQQAPPPAQKPVTKLHWPWQL
jgi:hypothetical protein